MRALRVKRNLRFMQLCTDVGRARNTIHMLVVSTLVVTGSVLSLTQPALAQDDRGAKTIDTPYGRAPATFADIVAKVKPAVVSVSVSNTGAKVADRTPRGRAPQGPPQAPQGIPQLPEDHPLYDFFKNLPREFGGQTPPPQTPAFGQGSGFVISEDGYIVTNNHVVEGATKIEVSFDNQENLDAELIGTDPRSDLALLKIKGTGNKFPYVKFATTPARVGDWVLAVGNPFGLGGTVTAGILSAEGRDIGSGPYDYIQVDAAVNRGNSGGPTFNLDGDVIGVNTAIFSPSGGNVGIAFAVPAKTAVEIIDKLKKYGTISRGWLGVKIQDVDEDIAASIGLADSKGALIAEILANGPAAGSSLRAQDAVIAINDVPVKTSRDLSRRIAEFAPDTLIDIKVWRNGEEQIVKVKLGRFPGSQDELARAEGDKSVGVSELTQLGLTLESKRVGGPDSEGVAIADVDPESEAALKQLKAGDTIIAINGQPVSSAADVVAAVKKANEQNRTAVLLSIKSGDQQRVVGLPLKKG